MADQFLRGDKELAKFFSRLPASSAERLQRVEIRNHLDHKKEVVRASSGFSAEGQRRLRAGRPGTGAIRVLPAKKVTPKRITDVTAETTSYWRGQDIKDPAEGVAARLEKRIGKPTSRPKRKRFLLIPVNDFLTRSGRPRRERRTVNSVSTQAKIDLRKLPNTKVIKLPSGKLLLIQRLKAGQRGRFESLTKGTRGKNLGTRDRVVGILVRQAKATQALDFFGSWARLAGKRDARYERMMNDIVKGTPVR